jgi:hypothetical protein
LSKLVSQDSYSVDSSTSLKMLLHFLWRTRIINLQYMICQMNFIGYTWDIITVIKLNN